MVKKSYLLAILIAAAACALAAVFVVQPYYAFRLSQTLGFQQMGFRSVAHAETMRSINHLRAQQGVEIDLIFFGASTIEGLDVRRFGAGAVNQAYGGWTLQDVLAEWRANPAMLTDRDVVLLAGLNDLMRGRPAEAITSDVHELLKIRKGANWTILIGVLPINETKSLGSKTRNEDILALNESMREICANFKSCLFVDPAESEFGFAAPLESRFDAGDGVHLTAEGYVRLANLIEASLLSTERN